VTRRSGERLLPLFGEDDDEHDDEEDLERSPVVIVKNERQI
jgi:hypothetical protein